MDHVLHLCVLDPLSNQDTLITCIYYPTYRGTTSQTPVELIAIMCSVDKFAPEREVIIRNKRNNKPCITRGIANSIRKCKALFKRALIDQTQEKKNQAYWKHLTKIKRAAKLNYYQQKCIEFKQNTKQLWQLINKINKKTNDKTSLIPKLKLDNLVYHSGKDVSNILAKHFSTVGKRYAEKIDKSQTPLKDYIEKIPKNDKSMLSGYHADTPITIKAESSIWPTAAFINIHEHPL